MTNFTHDYTLEWRNNNNIIRYFAKLEHDVDIRIQTSWQITMFNIYKQCEYIYLNELRYDYYLNIASITKWPSVFKNTGEIFKNNLSYYYTLIMGNNL